MTLYMREMEIKEESLELGRKQMQQQIARSLLEMLSDQEIVETTGLTIELVQKLRAVQK